MKKIINYTPFEERLYTDLMQDLNKKSYKGFYFSLEKYFKFPIETK